MQVIGKHEMYTLTQCPKNFSIGTRTTPGQIIPQYVGNTCEPWIARFAVIFLDRLLDAGDPPMINTLHALKCTALCQSILGWRDRKGIAYMELRLYV